MRKLKELAGCGLGVLFGIAVLVFLFFIVPIILPFIFFGVVWGMLDMIGHGLKSEQ